MDRLGGAIGTLTRRLGWGIAAGALAAAGILGWSAPAHAGAYVRLSEIARRFGLEARVDLLSGRQTLADAQNRIAVVPGGYQIFVNGQFATMEDRAGCDGGDVIVPASALGFIEANLVRSAPGRPTEPPAAPPVAAAQARPEAAPRAAPLRPPPGSAGTIVIDAGHGGPHTGARGARTGIYEKDINLAIARHLRGILEERGWRVLMTRDSDRALARDLNSDLDARADLANRAGADIFVSIHTNYAENPAVEGFEVFHYGPSRRSALLAREIERAMKAGLPEEDRGVKTAGFRVIKRARVPAALVEVGFVSNPLTEKRLATDAYRRSIAEAIARGVARFAR